MLAIGILVCGTVEGLRLPFKLQSGAILRRIVVSKDNSSIRWDQDGDRIRPSWLADVPATSVGPERLLVQFEILAPAGTEWPTLFCTVGGKDIGATNSYRAATKKKEVSDELYVVSVPVPITTRGPVNVRISTADWTTIGVCESRNGVTRHASGVEFSSTVRKEPVTQIPKQDCVRCDVIVDGMAVGKPVRVVAYDRAGRRAKFVMGDADNSTFASGRRSFWTTFQGTVNSIGKVALQTREFETISIPRISDHAIKLH